MARCYTFYRIYRVREDDELPNQPFEQMLLMQHRLPPWRQAAGMMRYRHTASFGKRQEFIAIAELLRRGFDVYQTLVDDQQIDCVIRKEGSGNPIYLDIQIKARSKDAHQRSWGEWPSVNLRSPRRNFFFIFYSEPADCYWIIPSLALSVLAGRTKSGKHEGELKVTLATYSNETGFRFRTEFEEYRNNFKVLENFDG